jgi:hypothetical protein
VHGLIWTDTGETAEGYCHGLTGVKADYFRINGCHRTPLDLNDVADSRSWHRYSNSETRDGNYFAFRAHRRRLRKPRPKFVDIHDPRLTRKDKT